MTGGPADIVIQFVPNTTEQNLNENGAGITTIMNIGLDLSVYHSYPGLS